MAVTYSPGEQQLIGRWQAHMDAEFVGKDAAASVAGMASGGSCNRAPVLTGGTGASEMLAFYRDHFIPKVPADMQMELISRTVTPDGRAAEWCGRHPRGAAHARPRVHLRVADRRDGAGLGGLGATTAARCRDMPRYFRCRHESLAVSLASGYYKATGRAQAVFLPSGLGVLNGAMALRTAYQERTPMTVLSPDTLTYGEVPEFDPGPEWPSLLIDFTGPARDGELCVKWAKEAKTAGDLVNELRRALYLCQAVPRGPTLLSVPFDLLLSHVALEARPTIDPHPVMAAPAQLDEVAAVLVAADSPLIITEHGGRSEADVAALTGLAELLGTPVFETMIPSYHNLPRTHPLCILGPVEPALEQADVILIAGANAPWNVHKYFADGAAVRSGDLVGNVLAPTPDYAKLAEAYGGSGERVTQPDAVPPALARALAAVAAGRCALLDVVVHP